MARWGMTVDLQRCVGCQTCTAACKQDNNLPPTVFWRRVHDIESGTFPNVQRTFLPMACMHCEKPTCMEVCPTTATKVRPDGIVYVEQELCVGCAYCIVACPYEARTIIHEQVPFFAPGPTPSEVYLDDPGRLGTATKCDLCYDRIDEGLAQGLTPGVDFDATPVCVNSCIGGAFQFGDLEDPNSPVSLVLKEHESARLLEELGQGPAVYYLNTPTDSPVIPAKQQKVWGWQAAVNFALGGIGAALYILSWLLGGQVAADGTPNIVQLVGPVLAALGLVVLSSEAGRPTRGIYLWRHFGSSWMSREVVAAAMFIGFAVAGWIWPVPGLRLLAAIGAVLFMICQGFIVLRARAVTAWNTPLMPWLFLASGLAGGAGLALVFGGGTAGVLSTATVICTLLSLAAWAAYLRRRGGEYDHAVATLRSWPWVLLIVGLGHLVPLLLLLISPAYAAAAVAGLLLALGSGLQKTGIILRAGYLRGIRF